MLRFFQPDEIKAKELIAMQESAQKILPTGSFTLKSYTPELRGSIFFNRCSILLYHFNLC